MTCDDIRDDLSGWLDNELDAARAGIVTEHLSCCERCRATSLAWGEQSVRLRVEGKRTPEPPSWERLAHRLEGEVERARRERGPRDGGHAERTRAAAPGGPAGTVLLEFPAAASGPKRRIGLRVAACAAAATVLIGIAAVFALRPGGTTEVHSVPASLPPDLVRELVDGDRRPDLRELGAVTPVSWDRFSTLPRDDRFAPTAPETLPGGYVFVEGWKIDSKLCRMVCARYRKGGRVVAVLQAESTGAPICTTPNPQCCRMAGLMCRRWKVDQVDVVQTTRGGMALTVAANAGETDMEAVVAALNAAAGVRKD